MREDQPVVDSAEATTTTPAPAPEPTESNSTGGTAAPDTTEPAQTADPDSGRQPAPDFSLELASGEVYTLSEGSKPVYLVFWAEW